MIITNGVLVTWEQPNRILYGHAVRFIGNQIKEIAPQKDLLALYPRDEVLDAAGQLVMPGNICAHTHFYGAFARGLGIPGDAPDAFPAILEKLWWSLDKSLSEEDVHYSALVCLVDAIRHGTTTLIDHHASPNAIDGSLDQIATACIEAGLRASLCYEVTDRDGVERMKAGVEENLRWNSRVRTGNEDGLLSGLFGLHASLTLSEETLAYCRERAPHELGFHIHVAEHPVDEEDSLRKTGIRVVERLQRHEMLGDNSIVVHAVHINQHERELLRDSKTWVTHQPRSNMNNAVGLPQVEAMLSMGIPVCLGNDGFSNAMWSEWKVAYLAHKLINGDPRRMNGMDVVQMGVYNNAALCEKLFGRRIGVLEPGAQADIIFVDYHPYTEMTAGNLPWHILFGFHESMVTTTMVAGKVLMLNRDLTMLDEELIAARARELSRKTWDRYQHMFA